MTNNLHNLLKSHSAVLDRTVGQIKFGTVTSVNPKDATVRVIIQPEGVLSGWLPVLSQWVGNSWGMICPPTPGDQVVLVPQEGDVEQGVIIGRVFSAKQMPPSVPSGELWLLHQSGSFLKLLNDGRVYINGDLHVNGDVYDNTGSLSRLRTHYNSHTHGMKSNGVTTLPTPAD